MSIPNVYDDALLKAVEGIDAISSELGKNKDDIEAKKAVFIVLKQILETVEHTIESARKDIVGYIFENGKEDAKNNKFFQFQDGIIFTNVTRRNVKLKEEDAIEILTAKGLLEDAYIKTLDKSKIEDMALDGRLKPEEIQRMVEVKTSTILQVKNDKDK